MGQLCLWSTVCWESGAVTCRKRVLARGGQGLVMVETEKLGRKEGNQESRVRVGLRKPTSWS